MTTKSTLITLAALLSPLLLAVLFVPPKVAYSQVPKEISADDLAMRAYMLSISEQLGVTCAYCHDMDNLASDKKRAFKVAKDHMRIVDLLFEKGFQKQVKVDCMMCHQGQPKPNY